MERLNYLFAVLAFLLALAVILLGLDAILELNLIVKNISSGVGFGLVFGGEIMAFLCCIAMEIAKDKIERMSGGKNG